MKGALPATCRWPLAEREALLERLTAAAGIARPGPAERFELGYREAAAPGLPALRAPAVLRAGDGAGVLLGVAASAGGRVRLVARDGSLVAVDAAALSAFLCAPAEARGRAELDAAVARAGFAGARGEAVGRALAVAALGGERVAEAEHLRPARPSIGSALRAAGAGRRLGFAAAGAAVELGLLVALWWLVGARAVAPGGGAVGPGWVAVVAALVAARLASSWAAGRLAIDVGAVLRERLLQGILALDPEAIRAEGTGQLMGRVVDTEAIESLALGGGLAATTGVFELATGLGVLAFGACGPAHLALAAGWGAVAFWLGRRTQRSLARWSAQRLALTHELVERMVGQRTLVAQEAPELRAAADDRALGDYAAAGRALDRELTFLTVLVPRGWLLTAVAVLAPRLAELPAHAGAFAASLGGALFVYGAARRLAQAFPALGAAAIAWRNVAELFAGAESGDRAAAEVAARAPAEPGGRAPAEISGSATETVARAPAAPGGAAGESGALLAARALTFRYPGRPDPVLSDCTFEIRRGDRVLLEGPSGGGKSTLGALLCGLRAPSAGHLALSGIDQSALGLPRWRARVGAAPQFHENHVFSASLLFNLLLGRAWPPRREDVAEAEAICRELDLGPLLARMPSGLEQLVGESGWQLSHGERGRLFIARSLLQPLEARVLDESFAALDPETAERALACVLRRAETLVVIAHP